MCDRGGCPLTAVAACRIVFLKASGFKGFKAPPGLHPWVSPVPPAERAGSEGWEKVLKIDGAFAPRVLGFDGPFGPEGCGGRPFGRQYNAAYGSKNHTTGLRIGRAIHRKALLCAG